jgi:hypothetical protein
LIFLAIVKKKRDLEHQGEEEPQLTRTEGRFETYTGNQNFYFKSIIF